MVLSLINFNRGNQGEIKILTKVSYLLHLIPKKVTPSSKNMYTTQNEITLDERVNFIHIMHIINFIHDNSVHACLHGDIFSLYSQTTYMPHKLQKCLGRVRL
jgi:hypothetical protein